MHLRFNLENGRDWIEQAFGEAAVELLDSRLVFPTIEPALAYVDSMRDTFESCLPQGLLWDRLMDQVGQQIASIVMDEGTYQVSKRTGVMIARKTRAERGRTQY